MKRILLALATLLGIPAGAQVVAWPALPAKEFIAGRAATKDDVTSGRAVFVAQSGGVQIGKPIQIPLPQYAWHKNGSKKTPVIIIQAEEASGQKVFGAKTLTGGYMAGLASEFELLGQDTPKN